MKNMSRSQDHSVKTVSLSRLLRRIENRQAAILFRKCIYFEENVRCLNVELSEQRLSWHRMRLIFWAQLELNYD